MAITLRVQNDSGSVADANSYVDEDYFLAYHEERGRDIEGIESNTVKAALVQAKDYLDTAFQYKGEIQSYDQSSMFPRYNLTDANGYLVQNVPRQVKQAQCEYAWIAKDQPLNPTPSRDESGRIVIQSSERVGPISESRTYAAGGAYSRPEYPVADNILKASGFIMTSGSIIRG